MPRRYKGDSCLQCERNVSECGPLSARGKCEDCGRNNNRRSIIEMTNHAGEDFTKWRRNHVAAVGGILIEDIPAELRSQIPGL